LRLLLTGAGGMFGAAVVEIAGNSEIAIL